jgi:Fungal specific transcription factor domain
LEDSSDDASDLETSGDDFGFVLSSQPKSNARSRHPPPERIHQLWQIFIENVDPLTKVVHVPTLRPAIQRAASNIGTIPRSFEALLFAIYGAAVMSLKDDECKQRLYEPRKTLLLRYISATKAALSRAKFMGTISVVVLQALVLHLLSVRDIYEPRVVWSLTGVAVRIAQGMGLDRDGVSLGLPPFEAEMRRRIWWLLKTHDFRTAELCGLAKFRDFDTGAESTKWPTNVNDDQLYPGMSSLVAESNTLTDVVFVALRYELANFAAGRIARFRQQGKNSSQWDLHASGSDKVEIDKAFREVEEILEMKYLRYCDPSQPLHLMTMLMARSAMNVVRFLTHHPRRWAGIEQTPLSERQWIWEISIKLLEQYNMVQSNPQLKQFAWHAAYFLHWHAFIHVLDTLRANPLMADAEKVWQLVGNTYENNPDMVFDTKKPIHVAVGNLCLKAYSAREAALQNGNICPPPTPQFVLQLRQQHEVAKAKRQARDAKSSQPGDPVSHGQADARDMGPRPDAGVIYSNDTLESTHLQQSTTSRPPSPTQPGGATEGDPFWFINGFDDSQAGNLNDVMNLDPDFMLAQDDIVEDSATQTITWEQWDAWLTDSNVIRPLSSARDLKVGI